MTAEPAPHIVEVERRIAAPPTVVFDYLTDPVKCIRWMGLEADLDPRPGGRYRVRVAQDRTAVGTYVEVDPPTRVVFTWGWEGSEDLPSGTTTVEITLIQDGDGTLLRLRHSGLPDAAAADIHRQGWDHLANRLVVAAAGGDPGPDPLAGA